MGSGARAPFARTIRFNGIDMPTRLGRLRAATDDRQA